MTSYSPHVHVAFLFASKLASMETAQMAKGGATGYGVHIMHRFRSTHDSSDQPTPDRLLAAADAILQAESATGSGSVTMWRDATTPARIGFSSHELVEAMIFLRRLGLASSEEPKPHQNRRG